MNNAALKLVEESAPSESSQNELEAKLIRIVEAIDKLLQRAEWKELETLLFSQEEARINRLILVEAKKDEIDEKAIFKLQGELLWARRYANIGKFAKLLKNQLEKKNG